MPCSRRSVASARYASSMPFAVVIRPRYSTLGLSAGARSIAVKAVSCVEAG